MNKDLQSKFNELTAPYLLPSRKVYIVPKEVWGECMAIYQENSPAQGKGTVGGSPAPTTMTHPNNYYPILVFSKYLFIDLGV